MNPRRYYLLIAGLAVAGLGLAFVVFPYFQQISLMLFYDMQYAKALPRYQVAYDHGNDTARVVGPLIDLELKEADDAIAIDLAEHYVKVHPLSLDAYRLLGKLLKGSGRLYAYTVNLSKIEMFKSSLPHLRELAVFYDYFGEQGHVRDTLQKIVASGKAESHEYQALAYQYASRGDSQSALRVLDELFSHVPLDAVWIVDAQFALGYLAAQGQREQAFQLAQRIILEHNYKESVALAAVEVMNAQQMIPQGLDLLAMLPAADQRKNAIVEARIRLLSADEAYAEQLWGYYQNLYDSHSLPKKFLGRFLSLALENDDALRVKQLVFGESPDNFDAQRLLRVALWSLEPPQIAIAQELRQRLGEVYLRLHPVLDIGLALATSGQTEATSGVNLDRFDSGQRFHLAELFAAKGYSTLAKEALLAIDSWRDIDDQELPDLAALYIQLHQIDAGVKRFAQLATGPEDGTMGLVLARLIFATAQGKTEEVLNAMDRDTDLDKAALVMLYNIAYQEHQPALALTLAERLNRKYPSVSNRARLGLSMVFAGNVERGLELLRELLVRAPSVALNYLEALGIATVDNPVYRQELDDQLAQMIRLNALSPARWRGVAFQMADRKLNGEATEILFPLAWDRPFGNGDVQTLLQIWGEAPPKQAIVWMEGRAATARDHEKAQWLKQLVDLKEAAAVLRLITERDLENSELADLYLTALVELKERCLAAEFILSIYPTEADVRRLRHLGKVSKDLDLNDLAGDVYERALELAPCNNDLVKELGSIDFARGYLSAAQCYLGRYLADGGDDYFSDYLYGEILWGDQCRRVARQVYWTALELLATSLGEKPDLQASTTEAQILYRLGFECEAIALYRELIENATKQSSLRSALANILIDLGDYRGAYFVLFDAEAYEPPAEDAYEAASLAVEIGVTRIRLLKEMRCLCDALTLSDELLSSYPDRGVVWSSRAQLENTIGRWPRALGYLEMASDLEPFNEGYDKQATDTWIEQAPFILLDAENRLTQPAQHERFHRVSGEGYIYSWLRLIVLAECDQITLDAYPLLSNGFIVPFDGNRERGTVALRWDCDSGSTWQGTLYAGDKVIGAGAEITRLDLSGRWALFGEYHQPFWDITESTIEFGVRNRIGFSRRQRVGRQFDVFGSLTYEQYNLDVNQRMATSYELNILLTYRLPEYNVFIKHLPEGTDVSYNLLLDKEHVLSQVTKINYLGDPFKPLGLNDLESYVAFLGLRLPFSKCFAIIGTAGYSYDRIGKVGGPMGTVGAVVGEKGRPQASIEFRHYQSSQTSSANVNSVDFNVKFPF